MLFLIVLTWTTILKWFYVIFDFYSSVLNPPRLTNELRCVEYLYVYVGMYSNNTLFMLTKSLWRIYDWLVYIFTLLVQYVSICISQSIFVDLVKALHYILVVRSFWLKNISKWTKFIHDTSPKEVNDERAWQDVTVVCNQGVDNV